MTREIDRKDLVLTWDGMKFREISRHQITLEHGRRLATSTASIDDLGHDVHVDLVKAMRINPRARIIIGPALFDPIDADYRGIALHEGGPYPATCWIRSDRNAVSTLYHELFHTIAQRIPLEKWMIVQAHGQNVRIANGRNPDHPDRRDPAWMKDCEEGEAYAFDHYATGRPQPFGLRLPFRARLIFNEILKGRYDPRRAPLQWWVKPEPELEIEDE